MYYFINRKKRNDWWVKAEPRWQRALMEAGVICPGCWRFARGVTPGAIDARVTFLPPSRGFDTVYSTPLCVMRRELADIVSRHTDELVWSDAILPDGQPSAHHRCAHSRDEVWLRGGRGSYVESMCPACGRPDYTEEGQMYAIERQLRGREVAMTRRHLLLVSERVRAEIEANKVTGLAFFPIEVRERAIDGFPDDPADWTPDMVGWCALRRGAPAASL
jgi:hypothetical protein